MKHRDFLQSLSTEQRRNLTQLNNHHALFRLSVLMLCLSICSTLIVLDAPYIFVWLVVQGLLLVSLFHLQHECIHDTVFKTKWANQLTAFLCGFVLFIPSIWFRHYHHAHHRYTQQPDKDPELASAKPATQAQWLIHVSGVSTWRDQFKMLAEAVTKPLDKPYLNEQQSQSARNQMLWMCGGYMALLTISMVSVNDVLLFLWIIPLIFGQPFLRLYLLAEHTDCEYGSNMLSNTRTVFTNGVVRWFTWNMPFHTEHHVYPSVAFHQLPALHNQMKLYLVETSDGYVDVNKRIAASMTR